MPLRPLSDTSAADWFVDSDADWWTKVILGPPGFEAYARVLYDLDEDAPVDSNERIRAAVRDVLARHTTTPDDCFFTLWDGWGGFQGGQQDFGVRYVVSLDASPSEILEAKTLTAAARSLDCAPAFTKSFLDGPMVSVPNREFYLFAGPLGTEVNWGAADYAHGFPRDFPTEPALMWPADHAWFMAGDVDPDWIGVGGTQDLIDALLADPGLDAVPTAYGPDQPEYR